MLFFILNCFGVTEKINILLLLKLLLCDRLVLMDWSRQPVDLHWWLDWSPQVEGRLLVHNSATLRSILLFFFMLQLFSSVQEL